MAAMDALPTTAGPPALPPIPTLTRRQENYARAVAKGMSYAQAFRESGCVASTAGSQSRQIGDFNGSPAVRARIQELRAMACGAEDVVDNLQERMAWLRLIISADPNELTRTTREPCDLCWPDAEIARAYAAHFSPTPFHDERPALPDVAKPRCDCKRCAGAGIARVMLTPTDELSPAGRALFKGAEQNEKGAIKIFMHDQLAAADMLNKLVSAYITRSLNLNANVAVHAARDASPEDALRLFEAFT